MMTETQKRIEEPDGIVEVAEHILHFNRQNQDKQPDTADMFDLESETFAKQRRNQEGQRLKMLTPNPMFCRLPISLAQLKPLKNSEKLKNEIRQLLYSLYRLAKLTKTIYNNFINTI